MYKFFSFIQNLILNNNKLTDWDSSVSFIKTPLLFLGGDVVVADCNWGGLLVDRQQMSCENASLPPRLQLNAATSPPKNRRGVIPKLFSFYFPICG